jgi:hypothetical protein
MEALGRGKRSLFRSFQSMIPKSGNRFSEKDHAQTKGWSGMMIRRKIIPL